LPATVEKSLKEVRYLQKKGPCFALCFHFTRLNHLVINWKSEIRVLSLMG